MDRKQFIETYTQTRATMKSIRTNRTRRKKKVVVDVPVVRTVKPKKVAKKAGRKRDRLIRVTELIKGEFLPNGFREGTHLHVSDLINKCVRSLAIQKNMRIPVPSEPLYDSTAITFRMGNAIADVVTDRLKMNAGDTLYGIWTCKCGLAGFRGVYEDAQEQERCEKCNHDMDNYNEIVAVNDDIMVSGSMDLTFLIEGAFFITELKSMAHDYWKDLKRPKPDHILQVLFYWWLMKEAGHKVHNTVSVMYVSKGMPRTSPYKEFTINARKEVKQLETYIKDARDYADSRRGEDVLPERVVCTNKNSPAAKRCNVCSFCFDME